MLLATYYIPNYAGIIGADLIKPLVVPVLCLGRYSLGPLGFHLSLPKKIFLDHDTIF